MEEVTVCDLCGSSLEVGRRIPGLEQHPLVECASCGLVTTTPRPVPAEIGAFYPDSYYAHVARSESWRGRAVGKIKSYRDGYPGHDPAYVRLWWRLAARALGRFFLTRLPYGGPGGRLLDVGCGVGDFVRWAADLGWEAHGAEIDPEAVRIARERGLDRVHQGTLQEQSFPDAYFDAITLHQALEHLYSPSAALAECHRVLRPDGAVYVSVPNFDSLPRRLLGEYWYGLQLPIHLYHFTPETLGRMAEKADFRVAGRHFFPHLVSARTTLAGLRAKLQAARPGPALGARAVAALLRASADPALGRMSDIMLFELRKPMPSAGT